MTEFRSMSLAAAAWCDQTMRNTVMDPVLATVFAKILRDEVEKAEEEAFQRGRESVYRPRESH